MVTNKRDCNLKWIVCNQNIDCDMCAILYQAIKIDRVYLKPVKKTLTFLLSKGTFQKNDPFHLKVSLAVVLVSSLIKLIASAPLRPSSHLPWLHPSAVFSHFNSRLSFRNHLLKPTPFPIYKVDVRKNEQILLREKFVRGTVEKPSFDKTRQCA